MNSSPEGGDELRLELFEQELLGKEGVSGVPKLGQHSLQQLHPERPQRLHLDSGIAVTTSACKGRAINTDPIQKTADRIHLLLWLSCLTTHYFLSVWSILPSYLSSHFHKRALARFV